jgi:uncharacterized membrane protein
MTKQPFLIPALIFLIISLPLVIGLIPRNRFYGIRTRRTLSDNRVWYAANKFGGWMFILSSLIYLVIAAMVPYLPDSTSVNWWVHVAGFILPLVIGIFVIHFYIKHL